MNNNKNRAILLVEDDPTAVQICDTIRTLLGYHIYRAKTISAANDRIIDEPGIEYFAYIIIDLNIPFSRDEFTDEERIYIKAISPNSNTPLSGWVWLQNHILNQNKYLNKNIIILSAYIDLLPVHEKVTRGVGIHFIDKTDEKVMEKIFAILKA